MVSGARLAEARARRRRRRHDGAIVTPEQWARLKHVFDGALEQPVDARRAWVAQQCADDGTLLREAEALLQTHETAGKFLEQPAHVDPADLETLLPGAIVGPYKVIEEIGRGGMGVVYRAEDMRLGQTVALKALPSAVAMHPELRQRLRREARAAATISHPAVAVVYALEEMDEHLFIASEYVRGETLRSEIGAAPSHPSARARSPPISPARSLRRMRPASSTATSSRRTCSSNRTAA